MKQEVNTFLHKEAFIHLIILIVSEKSHDEMKTTIFASDV